MAIKKYLFILLTVLLSAYACTSVQHISKTDIRYESISSKSGIVPDDSITAMIAPYKEKLDVQMNEVIANVAEEMTRKKPESTLGNWYTDAMLSASKKAGYDAVFAISNYGGLRVPYLSAGPLTRGELYELCPFDNLLLIVDVPGNILDTLLQKIASSDGWPISGDIRMTIKDHVMTSCTIANKPINSTATYKVAMPDYVANGGDDMKMLIPLPRIQTGLLVRDILIGYALETARNGKEISAPIEGRIIIQR